MPRKTEAPRLPMAALPPGKQKKEEPAPFDAVLPSGLVIQWQMPDVFAMITFDGILPDPITQGVLALLEEEKATRPDADPMKFHHSAQAVKGMYGLAAEMLIKPVLDASVEYGDGNGTMGRREIGYMDLVQIYWLFRLGRRTPALASANPAQPVGAAVAPSDSDGVSQDASGTSGA